MKKDEVTLNQICKEWVKFQGEMVERPIFYWESLVLNVGVLLLQLDLAEPALIVWKTLSNESVQHERGARYNLASLLASMAVYQFEMVLKSKAPCSDENHGSHSEQQKEDCVKSNERLLEDSELISRKVKELLNR